MNLTEEAIGVYNQVFLLSNQVATNKLLACKHRFSLKWVDYSQEFRSVDC